MKKLFVAFLCLVSLLGMAQQLGQTQTAQSTLSRETLGKISKNAVRYADIAKVSNGRYILTVTHQEGGAWSTLIIENEKKINELQDVILKGFKNQETEGYESGNEKVSLDLVYTNGMVQFLLIKDGKQITSNHFSPEDIKKLFGN